MAIKLYTNLTPGGDYPLIAAEDVEMPDGTRLSELEVQPENQVLTFAGAVEATYDGSEAVTVEIPEGGGVPEDFFTGGSVTETILETAEREFALDEDMGLYTTDISAEISLTIGDSYTVIWGTEEWACVAADISGAIALGNLSLYGMGEDSGEPFLIGKMGTDAMAVTAETDSSRTVGICKTTEEPIRVNEAYLPEGGGSVSWDDIENRPFYEESYSSEYSFADGSPEQSFNALGETWWRISELTPSTDKLLATAFRFTLDGTNYYEWTPAETEILLESEEITGVQSSAYGAGFVVCRTSGTTTVSIGGTDIELDIPAEGIYFAYTEGEAVPSTVSVAVSYSELKKLDEKYLPAEKRVVSVDMSGFEGGTIVQTYEDGSTLTYSITFDADGNPLQISDSNGNVIDFTW